MGSELERRDERELSISVEVGTGAFLPGGKIAMAFKRAWQHRAEEYLESVAAAAEVPEQEVIDAIAAGEGFSDVFAAGLQIITAESDHAYRNTFAAFVAAALDDPARVDIATFLLEKFGRLRPPHIRVFWSVCLMIVEAERRKQEGWQRERIELAEAIERDRFTPAPSPDATRRVRKRPAAPAAIMSDARRLARDHYTPGVWVQTALNLGAFSENLGLPPGVVTSLMRDLYKEGILGEESPDQISVTELGKLAYETVGEVAVSWLVPDSVGRGKG